jgi:plastocyanin
VIKKNNQNSMKNNCSLGESIAFKISSCVIFVTHSLKSTLFIASLLLCATAVRAQSIVLLDQTGEPIADAVVGIALADSTTPYSAANAVAIMDQINKQFYPRLLVIQEGQSVSFPNSDDIRHHVYSFSAAKPFEIKLFKGAVTQPIVFERPGIVVLGCNIHDNMVGYIYVAKNEQTYISNELGQIELPAGSDLITIWHANLSTQNSQRDTVNIAKLSPLPGSNVIPITLDMVLEQTDTEAQQKSTSKFMKKFN